MPDAVLRGSSRGRILVAPAQLDPVDLELGGGEVDQPLHVVVAFRPAGAAIGRDMRGIGEHALGRHLDQRRAVDALDVLHGVERRRHRPDLSEEAAHIAEAREPQRQEGAVGIERELGGELVVAAVAVGDEAARALVGPLDRAAERARGMQHADIFGKRRRLHAERAAHVRRQDADLLRLDLEDLRHVAAQAEHALRGRMQREAPARRIVDADRRARLHGAHHHATVDELDARHMRGLGEGGLDLLAVAVVVIERDVTRHIVIEQRGVRAHRLVRPGDGGQLIDVELDRLGRVFRLQHGFRHHAGDRIADEAHFVGRKRRPQRLAHRRAVAIVERHDAFERAVGREVGAGVDAEHARHAFRGRDVDPLDDAVGVAAANHHRIGLARKLDVVGVAAMPTHQRGVLGARHRLADAEFHQCEALRVVLQIHELIASSKLSPASGLPAGEGSHTCPCRWRA